MQTRPCIEGHCLPCWARPREALQRNAVLRLVRKAEGRTFLTERVSNSTAPVGVLVSLPAISRDASAVPASPRCELRNAHTRKNAAISHVLCTEGRRCYRLPRVLPGATGGEGSPGPFCTKPPTSVSRFPRPSAAAPPARQRPQPRPASAATALRRGADRVSRQAALRRAAQRWKRELHYDSHNAPRRCGEESEAGGGAGSAGKCSPRRLSAARRRAAPRRGDVAERDAILSALEPGRPWRA